MGRLRIRPGPKKILLALMCILSVSNIPLSFADREIKVHTVADVRKDLLVGAITNLSQYPKIFPENVQSVKILDNKTHLVYMKAGVNGFFFDTKAVYEEKPDGTFEVGIISGDLKGTTMTTNLTKTWSFDGEPDKGTIVNMDVDLKTSGFLSLVIGFVPENSLVYALDEGFGRITEYAKSETV